MTLTAPLPGEVGEAPARDAENQQSAGWFVRITILVVVLLWLVPIALLQLAITAVGVVMMR